MKLELNKLYHYIFSDKHQKEVREFFFGEAETSSLIKEKIRPQFRIALRTLEAKHLEASLFGNTTDPLPSDKTYPFPSNQEIAKQFKEMEKEHCYFKEKKAAKLAEQLFVAFFKTAKIVGDFIEENNDANNSIAYEHAYKMVIVFGQNPNNIFKPIKDYLDKFKFTELDHPLHDALTLSLPTDLEALLLEKLDLKGWRLFIQKHGPAAFGFLNNAFALQKNLENKAPTTIAKARKANDKTKFRYEFLWPELANLCKQFSVSEETFNKCLNIRYKIDINSPKESYTDEEKERLLQEAKKAELTIQDDLPDVIIESNKHPGYYLVKLPKDDPNAYFLGYMTSCCQYIGGNASQCVIDGVTLKNNGFYVLLKIKRNKNQKQTESKTDAPLLKSPFIIVGNSKKINYNEYDIVGQAYTWISQRGNLVFDSWENKTPERDDPIIVSLLEKFSQEVTRNHSPLQVNIGKGGKTPAHWRAGDSCFENMLEGTPYGDSAEQSMIYCNEERRQTFVTKLQRSLETVLENEKDSKDVFWDTDKKAELYEWVANHCSSEKYFHEMQALLSAPDLGASLKLFVQLNNDYASSGANPVLVIRKMIEGLNYLKETKIDAVDIKQAVLRHVNNDENDAKKICAAIRSLEELKLESESKIRKAVLEQRNPEAYVNEIRETLTMLQASGLKNDIQVRDRILLDRSYAPISCAKKFIAAFNILEAAGRDTDRAVYAAIFYSDMDTHFIELRAENLIKALKIIEDTNFSSDANIKQHILNYKLDAKYDFFARTTVKRLEKLKEQGLDKEADVRQMVLQTEESFIHLIDHAAATLENLKKNGMEKEWDIRKILFLSYKDDSDEACPMMIKALTSLREAKKDQDPAIRQSVFREKGKLHWRADEQAKMLIDASDMLKEAKLDEDKGLWEVILNFNGDDSGDDRIVKKLVSAFKQLKSSHLDQDPDIRSVIFKNLRNADDIAASITYSFKKLNELGIEVDTELRQAVIQYSSDSHIEPSRAMFIFEKLKECGLEKSLKENSTIFKKLFFHCKDIYELGITNSFQALSLCQQAGLKLSAELCDTILKDPVISVLRAKSLNEQVNQYESALAKLKDYIKDKQILKKRYNMMCFFRESEKLRPQVGAAVDLEHALRIGAETNIRQSLPNNLDEDEHNPSPLKQIHEKLCKIIFSPENTVVTHLSAENETIRPHY